MSKEFYISVAAVAVVFVFALAYVHVQPIPEPIYVPPVDKVVVPDCRVDQPVVNCNCKGRMEIQSDGEVLCKDLK